MAPPTTSIRRVASAPARSNSCDATMTVAPALAASRKMLSISSLPEASRPACGSSSNQISARRTIKLANAHRRRCPADSCDAFIPASRPSIRIVTIAVATSDAVAATVDAQNCKFCITVRSRYKPFAWPSKPTRERIASLFVARSIPRTCPVPRSIGSSPAHTRKSEVLPAPFGPCNNTISPRCWLLLPLQVGLAVARQAQWAAAVRFLSGADRVGLKANARRCDGVR